MNTTLMNIPGNLANKTQSYISSNFSAFLNHFSGNTTGLIFSVSIRDNTGDWHTKTQRIFKNGSVHTKIS